jgi:anti-sigma factor RsiW
LSTLAAAYAETGDFENAKKWSAKSIEVAEDDKTRDELKKELANYEAGKPTREVQEQADEAPAAPPETSHTFAPPSAAPAPARTLDF